MRKVLFASIAVVLVASAVSSRDGHQRNGGRLQAHDSEVPRLETARLFSASIDRFDVTNSVTVSQPTVANWPEAPKPKPEKHSLRASKTPKIDSTPVTKSAPKKQAAKQK